MINDMCKTAKQYVNYSLFADDVAIWSTDQDHLKSEKKVQRGLDEIVLWCRGWGFTLSAEKSATMAFTRSRTSEVTRLFIDGKAVNETADYKFLGVHLDKHLTFSKHIKAMKLKCAKRTNILRALAGTNWGGDRKTLLQIYIAIIRPIIEYCSIAYHGSLTDTQHKQVEAIQNTCIRIATGALPGTRTTALLADANLPTCQERRTQQLCRYAIQIQSTPNHPVQKCFAKPVSKLFMQKKALSRHPPFFDQLNNALTELQFVIPETAAKPKAKPFWLRSPPRIDYLFCENKSDITPTEMQARFNEYKSQYPNKTFMYTDGSKHDHKVAFALSTTNFQYKQRLPDKMSIFTAEATALLAAVNVCVRNKYRDVVICSDSKSVLQALKNVYNPSHHVISWIQETIPEKRNISFIWIPGHANIPGNERADKLAKEALDIPEPLKAKYPVDDCKTILQQHIRQLRQRTWDETGPQHLHSIKPQLGTWVSARQNSRIKEVSLTRLRTGQTMYTAPWLETQQQNICPFCNHNTVPTVHHILLQCHHFDQHRRHITAHCLRENMPLNLSHLLGDNHPELLRLLFQYLRDTKLIGTL